MMILDVINRLMMQSMLGMVIVLWMVVVWLLIMVVLMVVVEQWRRRQRRLVDIRRFSLELFVVDSTFVLFLLFVGLTPADLVLDVTLVAAALKGLKMMVVVR